MAEAWKRWQGRLVAEKFVLREYLGGSEHSAVFLTERKGEPHKAAIKLIATDPTDAYVQLARWSAAAKLSHPHLIRLFEMGRCELDGVQLLFVVMEYAEENLSQIIPQRPLTTGEAREVAVSAVDALLFLHEKGLVHRSLRLSNVMAAGDQLKLSSDCVGPADESGKQPGQASAYDPMEEASGTASRAGDAWSFGVMLCQSLTQRVP